MPLGAHQETPDDQSQPAALPSSPTKSPGRDLNGGHENQPPSNQHVKGRGRARFEAKSGLQCFGLRAVSLIHQRMRV